MSTEDRDWMSQMNREIGVSPRSWQGRCKKNCCSSGCCTIREGHKKKNKCWIGKKTWIFGCLLQSCQTVKLVTHRPLSGVTKWSIPVLAKWSLLPQFSGQENYQFQFSKQYLVWTCSLKTIVCYIICHFLCGGFVARLDTQKTQPYSQIASVSHVNAVI